MQGCRCLTPWTTSHFFRCRLPSLRSLNLPITLLLLSRSASAATGLQMNTSSQQSGQDQLPRPKPQCEEGEILRKGNASRSRSLSPRNSRLVASTCHRSNRSNHRSNRNDRCGISTARQANRKLAAEVNQADDQEDLPRSKDVGKCSPIRSVRQRVLLKRSRNLALSSPRSDGVIVTSWT